MLKLEHLQQHHYTLESPMQHHPAPFGLWNVHVKDWLVMGHRAINIIISIILGTLICFYSTSASSSKNLCSGRFEFQYIDFLNFVTLNL